MAQQDSQPYDRALKSLFGDEAAEILPRLVEGVELIDEQNIEIDRSTLSEQEKQIMYDNLYEYDSLIDDNPDIQKRVAKGETRGAQEIVTALVEVRFPKLVEVAQQKIPGIQSVEMLSQLTKQIATAEDEKTALWVLNSYAA